MTTYIGLDIGGTKGAAALVKDGTIIKEIRQPTAHGSQAAVIAQFVDLVQQLRTDNDDVAAVGVGVPSTVEFATGRILSSRHIALEDVPLREVLTKKLNMPVYIDNDATCAAYAEAFDENGKLVSPNLIMFTIGTGVGGGIVLNGEPYRGVTGGAGELGHEIVTLDMRKGVRAVRERFPRKGSLESIAAGSAFDVLAVQTAQRYPSSALGLLVSSGKSVAGVELVEAAQNGDVHAKAAIELLGQRLGIGMANMINIFDPGEIVVGGGASSAGDLLLEPAIAVARAYAVAGCGKKTVIRLARQGNRAGLLGAAMLAQVEFRKEQ